MSSTPGPRAIHQILDFTEEDNRRGEPNLTNAAQSGSSRSGTTATDTTRDAMGPVARNVSPMWGHVRELYFSGKPPPPLGYLRSPELLLQFKDVLDGGDMQVVCGHGYGARFYEDNFPKRLISKVVQAFLCLQEEPSSINITVDLAYTKAGQRSESRSTVGALAEMWPEVYDSHLPCATCTTLEQREDVCVSERFHVFSKHFGKKLTVELTFELWDPPTWDYSDVLYRPSAASQRKKMHLLNVKIYLDEGLCSSPPAGTTRKSESRLIHLEFFVSEVYGFIDRAHIGASLTANSDLSKLVSKLTNRLPVHQLMCEFKAEAVENGITSAYWLNLHHFRPDLPYTDVRRLKLPSEAGPAADCALILRYLSNSHVFDFKAPVSDSRFTLRMLAAFVGRNFSVGRLRMCVLDDQLTDYRSINAVFDGGLRLGKLHLRILRKNLAALIKTTDFLRMPTIQELEELKLKLTDPPARELTPRHRRAVVSSPLWITGIHLLSDRTRFEVKYGPDRSTKSIALKLVQLCEKFERGEITEIVDGFKFTVSRRRRRLMFPFNARNRLAPCGPWDVYRFRNPATGVWLTALVGHEKSGDSFESSLSITTREVRRM